MRHKQDRSNDEQILEDYSKSLGLVTPQSDSKWIRSRLFWSETIALVALIILVAFVFMFINQKEDANTRADIQTNRADNQSDRADNAAEVAVDLAEQVRQACREGGKTARDLGAACGAAREVTTDLQIIQGAQGSRGRPGATGFQGIPGSQGPQGIPGVAGPPGPSGPSGVQGVPGEQGLPGQTGQEGSPGPAGAVGKPGPTGAAGEPGPAGPKGEPGPAGIAGPPGPNCPEETKSEMITVLTPGGTQDITTCTAT